MKRLAVLLTLCVATGLFYACDINEFGPKQPKDKTWDKVLVIYQAGCNSLSEELRADIRELKKGKLPALTDRQAIVIIAHHPVSYASYGTKTSPCIIRLYKDAKGAPVLDTLVRLGTDDLLTRKDVMSQTLNYVAENFKTEHYGLILSSHGTGWLPADYYNNPVSHVFSTASGWKTAPAYRFPQGLIPYVEPEPMPGPKVRTYGEERVNEGGTLYKNEMDIKDLAAALPYHFDYILMDVCLMGGVEVAYELKDRCDFLGFSPTEILAAGLDYALIAEKLLKKGDPDLKGVINDYYDIYAAQSGDYQSACFTLVDCRQLESLATACRAAFSAGRDAIAAVDPDKVQPFFRSYHHWFYDLKDILDQSGVPSADVGAALRKCISHSVHTDAFMPGSGGFVFNTYCGLSMYLPCAGSAYLDAYYQALAWNKATSLVQ